MPSNRPGFYCDHSPLKDITLPRDGDKAEACVLDVARAVAYAAGLKGEMSDDPTINDAAQKCAKMILDGECPKWKISQQADGGFLPKEIPDKRHRELPPQE